MKRSVGKYQGVWLFFLMATWVLICRDREWLAVLLAAVLHEGGHWLAARLCGVRIVGFRVGLSGARMALDGLLSYKKEFLIAAGGPLANFVCAWFVCWMGEAVGEGRELFFYASLGLGILNMLPVGSLDGGRMISAVIGRFLAPDWAAKVVGATTAICLGSLWLLTVYGLLCGAPMVSLSVFFLYLLLKTGLG